MTDTASMAATVLPTFKMTPSGIGQFEIELDGERVEKNVAAVHIQARGNDIPVVSLELSANAGALPAFEGLARVQVLEPVDPGPAAAAFLSAIDPSELSRAALNSPTLGNEPDALTAEMLRVLTKWALGEDV